MEFRRIYFHKYCISIALLFLFGGSEVRAQEIDQSRGVDQTVDYESLKEIGPWDDRNYQLTATDLGYLADNEKELKDPIPVFYRVIVRKTNTNMMSTGPAQYPRSALQHFNIVYTGYQVDGEFYRKVEVVNNRYEVITTDAIRTSENQGNNRLAPTEVRVTSPEGAAESAIKIHPLNPDIVVAGSNGPGGGQKMHYSSNGGNSWTEVTLPLGNTCCDPTIDYSADGNFVYTSTLGVGGGPCCAIWFYRSSDNGMTWTDLETQTPGDPRRELTPTNGSDKQFIHSDKHCTSPHQDNIYMTWHTGNVMQFSRSTDFGNNWDTNISFSADPRGIGSDIVTDANGIIYYVYPAFVDGLMLLKRSTDGGATFEPGTIQIADTEGGFDYPIPAMDIRRVFIYAAVDADLSSGPYGGSIYAAWTDTDAPEQPNAADNHSRIQVGYSRDQGNTWTVVTPHETADAMTVDRFHPWLAVDVEGNVHVVFYDTRLGDRTSVDFFHSMSTDGAQTFSTPERLTTTTSPKINNGFEWGDYNGMDHVVRQSSIFTDNRDESGGSGQSVDVYSTTELQGGSNNNSAPDQPTAIEGPATICVGQSAPYEVPFTNGAESFDWSFSDGGATITGNGTSQILIEGIGAAGGTLSVSAVNRCGTSSPITFTINIAAISACDIANCVEDNLTIDDATLAGTDIFDIIQTIDSDATVTTGSAKVFRAGTSIEFLEGFSTESSSLFIAQIENCMGTGSIRVPEKE